MNRVKLPDRRRSWRQKIKMEGQTFYLTVGEHESGQPGEVFIDAAKQGTFTRGVLDALARMTSMALQCGAPLAEVCRALRGLNFPPQGRVESDPPTFIAGVSSVADWIARELEAAYLKPDADKVAGVESEPWRSGV